MDYLNEYNAFIADYSSNIADPRKAGEVLGRMAQHYATYNMKLIDSSRNLAIIAKDIENQEDEKSGKTITSAKASVLVAATAEAFSYQADKIHVQNIEQFINSLKTIAKLISGEWNVMGSI